MDRPEQVCGIFGTFVSKVPQQNPTLTLPMGLPIDLIGPRL